MKNTRRTSTFRAKALSWVTRAFFRNSSLGGGASTEPKGQVTILYWMWTDDRWWQKVWWCVVCDGRGSWGILLQKKIVFPPLGLYFLHFLKPRFLDIHWALHYTVYRPNLQLSTCMVCLCSKYPNSVTNLLRLAFQQLKSIGSGIYSPLGNF